MSSKPIREPSEPRNIFEPQEIDRFNYRLYHPGTGTYLFVSNDKSGGDHIVEGHPFRDEFRNQFEIRKYDDASTPFGDGETFTFFNLHYQLYMFVSNDKRGHRLRRRGPWRRRAPEPLCDASRLEAYS